MEKTDTHESIKDETVCVAKLFCMKESDEWEELYVGLCTVVKKTNGQWCILMCGIEDKEGEVLVLTIDKLNKYEPYDEVLLLWKEALCSYSLSFLQKEHRDTILSQIRSAQQEMEQTAPSPPSASAPSSASASITTTLELPPVSVDNLSTIYRIVTSADISQIDSFHSILRKDNYLYLHELLDLFPLLELSHNKQGILTLYNICQLILDLGYDDVVNKLFSDELYLNWFGLMEYKPDLAEKAHYREYYKNHVHFCNTIPALDSSLLQSIHTLYRLIYYRDAIDPQPMDEIIPTSITSLMRDVIILLRKQICSNNEFIKNMLEGIDKEESIHMSLCVLNELFMYCKGLSITDKEALVRALEQKSHILTSHLHQYLHNHPHSSEISLILSILEYRILFSLDSFRLYCIETNESILKDICLIIDRDTTYSLSQTAISIIHDLLSLDSSASSSSSHIYTKFFNLFYEQYAPLLTSVITKQSPAAELILNLFTDYSEVHGTNLQYLLLKNNLFPAILKLLESPHRNLQLACIQFMSMCCSSSLNWYQRFIIKRNYLHSILDYADKHVEEDTIVMSSTLHLIQICLNSNCIELNTYIKGQLKLFANLSNMTLIKNLVNCRKRNGDSCLESCKVTHMGY